MVDIQTSLKNWKHQLVKYMYLNIKDSQGMWEIPEKWPIYLYRSADSVDQKATLRINQFLRFIFIEWIVFIENLTNVSLVGWFKYFPLDLHSLELGLFKFCGFYKIFEECDQVRKRSKSPLIYATVTNIDL